MRIEKLLSEHAFGSKKQVERLFVQKRVTLNGQLVTKPNTNVDPTLQEICVDGKRITGKGHVYFLLNKPAGVVTAVRDGTHQTVLDLLSAADRKAQVFPVGRLDRDTEGLLLLTDNGQLAYQLLLPEKQIMKEYRACINERVTEADVAQFAAGIEFIGGVRCQPAKLQIDSYQEGYSWVRVGITEGKFHQVKKMFLAVGKKVVYLQRTSMGPLRLDPSLATGEYRPLTPVESQQLLPFFNEIGGGKLHGTGI